MTKEFNPVTARKCPECGSKDYARSITYSKISERFTPTSDRVTIWVRSDMTNFHCKSCGFEQST